LKGVPPRAYVGVDPARAGTDTWVLEIGVSGWRITIGPSNWKATLFNMSLRNPAGEQRKMAFGRTSYLDAVDCALATLDFEGVEYNRIDVRRLVGALDEPAV